MKPTSRDDVLGGILELLVSNIEHDGSYIPVSAIRKKFPEAVSALNLYINQELIRLIGPDEPNAKTRPEIDQIVTLAQNKLRHKLRQSVNNRGKDNE